MNGREPEHSERDSENSHRGIPIGMEPTARHKLEGTVPLEFEISLNARENVLIKMASPYAPSAAIIRPVCLRILVPY